LFTIHSSLNVLIVNKCTGNIFTAVHKGQILDETSGIFNVYVVRLVESYHQLEEADVSWRVDSRSKCFSTSGHPQLAVKQFVLRGSI
jgi:hypothetical protein